MPQTAGLLPSPAGQSQSVPSTSNSPTSSSPQPWTRPFKQFSLFFLGAGFLAASVAVSRRSVLRRQRLAFPKFYSSNGPAPEISSSEGSLLGIQALGLATLNVTSFAIMLTGGLSWAFDLSTVEELRAKTQTAMRQPGKGVSPEDEKEFEDMMNSLLERLGMDKVQVKGEAGKAMAASAASAETKE